MILEPRISPLPFYESVGEQFANNPTAFGTNYPYLCPIDEPPTFFFFTDYDPNNWSITSVSVVQVGVQSHDVTRTFRDGSRSLVMYDADVQGRALSYIRFAPTETFTGYTFPAVGLYYYVLGLVDTDTGQELKNLYSEVFCVKDNMQNAIKIEYTNANNISTANGDIPFGADDLFGGFKLRLWVDALIGKPTYNFEENATRRMGYEFLESVVSAKTYRFVFIAPEYLCDAFRLIKVCSDKTIRQGHRTYEPTTFNVEVDWQEQGDLAAVEVTFDTDNIMAVIGGYSNT